MSIRTAFGVLSLAALATIVTPAFAGAQVGSMQQCARANGTCKIDISGRGKHSAYMKWRVTYWDSKGAHEQSSIQKVGAKLQAGHYEYPCSRDAGGFGMRGNATDANWTSNGTCSIEYHDAKHQD